MSIFVHSEAESQHFAQSRETMCWIERWLTSFRIMAPSSSTTTHSLAEIEWRAPAVGAKVCFYFYFCHAAGLLARCSFEATYFLEVLCHGLWVDFDAVFPFFGSGCPFIGLKIVTFVVRWRNNFRDIGVANSEKSKNRRKSIMRTTSYR